MRLLACALLPLLFAPAASAATDERPVVQVDFVFHAMTCNNQGTTRYEADKFAQIVAGEFADEFQFAVWRTAATLQPGEKPEATLTVQLRAQDERSGPRRGIAYYIDYFRDAEMNGAKLDHAMSSYIGKKAPLYEWDDYDRPCGPNSTLAAELKARTSEDVHTFRQAWIDNFLRYVPIAKNIPGPDDKHANAVMLANHWKPMHAGLKSHIELNVGGDVKAFFTPIAIHDAQDRDPLICAHVTSLRDSGSVTSDVIKAMLQSYKSNKYIRLFMTDYELNRDTQNYQPVSQQPD